MLFEGCYSSLDSLRHLLVNPSSWFRLQFYVKLSCHKTQSIKYQPIINKYSDNILVFNVCFTEKT